METKICKKCGIEKEIENFAKYKKYNKEYIRGICRKCTNEHIKEYRNSKKDVLKEKRKKYYKENPQIFKKYKERYKSRKKEWEKKYREKNKEKIKATIREYNQKHKNIRNIKEKEKRKKDKIYRLKINIRLMINSAFKRKGEYKTKSTENILGCDINFFTKYLLQTFKNNYGYKWDGTEKVHIDHIIPLVTANSEEEIIKLCHYTNLQLLKAEDNLKKGNKLNWRLEVQDAKRPSIR